VLFRGFNVENGEYVRDIIFYVVCQRENIVGEWKAIHKSEEEKREREREIRFEQKM
jgi:hypothetical protein